MPNFFDLILSFFQLFDALVDARERFGPAEDMADLHGAAGRHGLAGNGDAHRPHDESVFAAEFRRRADQTVVHGLLRPVGDGRETRAHFPEHVERDGLVALGLLVDVERGVVLGQRIEEAELFGNVRELFGALLQNGGDEGGIVAFGLDGLADPRLGGARERLGGHGLDVLAVEVRELFDIENGRGLRDAGHIERLRELVDRKDLALTAGRPAEERDVVHDRLGEEALCDKIDKYLVKWRANQASEHQQNIAFYGYQRDTYKVNVSLPRFGSGEAKGVVNESVRGFDLYIITDVFNYSCTYNMYGMEVPMSPDDHYADLKRVISAISGKAKRITILMPMLYEGRQHKRSSRESLDCALALQELVNLGVDNIMTFDAHDKRVQNAIPNGSFENIMPTYQMIKSLVNSVEDLHVDKDHLMVISPDEGALHRCIYFATQLGVNLGMFYKRRDYTRVVNGRNPIVAHEYLGESVEGKTVFIADDIIASGESMLEVASNLKERGAANIIANATFPLFTSGLEKFDKAVADGTLTYVVGTNLTYRMPELLTRDWYVDVDVSKYAAYFVVALNHDMSVSSIIDPIKKIEALLASRK